MNTVLWAKATTGTALSGLKGLAIQLQVLQVAFGCVLRVGSKSCFCITASATPTVPNLRMSERLAMFPNEQQNTRRIAFG